MKDICRSVRDKVQKIGLQSNRSAGMMPSSSHSRAATRPRRASTYQRHRSRAGDAALSSSRARIDVVVDAPTEPLTVAPTATRCCRCCSI